MAASVAMPPELVAKIHAYREAHGIRHFSDAVVEILETTWPWLVVVEPGPIDPVPATRELADLVGREG